MFIFNSKHGAAHYGNYTVRRWLWMFPAVALVAWGVGFLAIPSLLGRLGVLVLSGEDRYRLAAEVEVSRDTGEPIP